MSKHRRLELEHFCLQYYEWKAELCSLNYLPVCDYQERRGSIIGDPTGKNALRASFYRDRMTMIEDTAKELDIGDYIFKAVTEGLTFSYFEARGIPCGRVTFYDRLKEFYWRLDKVRN